jgi:hypothetical protein
MTWKNFHQLILTENCILFTELYDTYVEKLDFSLMFFVGLIYSCRGVREKRSGGNVRG